MKVEPRIKGVIEDIQVYFLLSLLLSFVAFVGIIFITIIPIYYFGKKMMVVDRECQKKY